MRLNRFTRFTWKVAIGTTIGIALTSAAFAQGRGERAVWVPPTTHVTGVTIIGGAVVRLGPGAGYSRETALNKNTPVTITAWSGRNNEYAQISYPDGHTGWLAARLIRKVDAQPAAAPPSGVVEPPTNTPAQTAPIHPIAEANPAPSVQTTHAGVTAPSAQQKSNLPAKRAAPSVAAGQSHPIAPIQPAARDSSSPSDAPSRTAVASVNRSSQPAAPSKKTASDVEKDLGGALSGAKPDLLGGAKDTPAATFGDSFRMLIVLLPILGAIVLAIRGLKTVQQRRGTLPDFSKGIRKSLLGGFNLANARKQGGSSIRVIESVPLGSAGLHLVEVRGRSLLVGATGGSIVTLADLSEPPAARTAGDSDFHAILNGMALDGSDSDDDRLGHDDDETAIPTVVGSIEEQIRLARESIALSAVRARSAASRRESGDDTLYRR